ncbi:Hermansky-Pudlak syndrome 5 protein homolog [Actinia tenebrosa]|uniref:Hermansky-Pudlak syndrome 5 protein homolog n=1 Tax=Actinia tenebrosa TaxID=6105 RepID=A0A6P8GWY2_ACTTE|nr:Hermansky-Pudlak syndrome 5 protein homolog [Actinia tenebrosa]
MAADSGGSSLIKVLGEYGVFLVEMGSLQDIYGSLMSMSRIKHTCMSTGRKYLAVGNTSGGIYIYNRKTLKYVRLISTKEGGIIRLCFAHEKSYLGVATSNGIVLVIDIGSRTRDKPKCLRRSEEHKNARVTCFCWDDNDSRLFAGDDQGFVSAAYLPVKFGSSVSQPKKSLIGHKSAIVGKSETTINQLDYVAEKLLISTMTKTAVLDLAMSQCWLVGSKPREGAFGACFLKQFNQESATIYTARPGSRLWEASIDGQVISTQHYKQLLAVPPSPVLGYGHDAETTHSKDEHKPKSLNFAKLLLIRERFLLTWQDSNIFLLDPVLGQLAGWYQLNQEISDVCCHGNQFYIYHSEGHMTWYGVLTVKETVARLFEISDFNQCIKVALECKSYLIPGTAREWVPVSMVTSLIRGIQEQPDSQELVESLQELEQLLQENTNMFTDKPPGFHGDRNMIDSPETMSVNSDICSHHMDSGLEDDDNLSVNQGDVNGEQASGFQKDKKELSFENALFSVAAKAKKFAGERQKSNLLRLPSFRKKAADSPTKETKKDEDFTEERGEDERMETVTNEGPATEEMSGGADLSVSEMPSPGVPRKTASLSAPGSDGVMDLSDENEPKFDSDGVDISTRRTKDKVREKRKKKRRVVTVDINTPSNKSPEKKSGTQQEMKMRSDSYSSYEDTKMKLKRSQSERASPISYVIAPTLNDVLSELPPAIPAMLSKAKVLIKKKLTPGDNGAGNPFDFHSTQGLPDQNEGEVKEEEKEEVVQVPCPANVEELENVTTKVREEVRAPKMLYNRKALRHVLQEWIPVLHRALDSCNKSSSSSQSPGVCLKDWLNETSYADVCMLTQMCLDTGMYARDQEECSRDSSVLVRKEIEERTHDEKDCSRDYTEVKIEVKSSSCHGESTTDVISRDQEICSLNNTLQSDSMRDARESPRDIDQSRDNADVIGDKEQSRDGYVDMESSREVSHERNIKRENSNGTSLSNYETRTEWTCDSCSWNHESFLKHILMTSLSQASQEAEGEKKRDWDRAYFIKRYFELLRVKDIRGTLGVTTGHKDASWSVLLQCIRESLNQDDVSNHIKEGNVTRALHVLHDGILEYQHSLLLHLVNLYELSGRETLMTCVRMYPDVLPWEVMEICRHGMSRDPQTSAQYFVYYIDQLLRWGVDVRERRTQKISTLCSDLEFTRNWFHSALIASNPDGQRHCHCGLPRSGSHKLPWKQEEQLQQLLDVVCQRRVISEMSVFLDICWRHGYWAGVLRLFAAMNHRNPIIQVIVSLGDMANLDTDKPWGPTPQCLDEWKTLLVLVASKTSQNQQHACSVIKDSDWSPDINWENVVHLALKRLGASRLVPLLQEVPYQEMSLPVNFYHKCIMGIVIEKEQGNLIHQMLTKMDTYFWSKRAGVLTPEMNYQRIQEQESKPRKDGSVASITSLSRVKTIEDAATNWGVNIHLADAVCPVCTLQLGEQVSTSNQGLLVFECGHVFHRLCVPERACVVCFHQNLKTLGKARVTNEENSTLI